MFNQITEEMISNLDAVNRERFESIRCTLEQDGLVPPIVLRRFSDLAFSLAKKSMKTGESFPIANPLLEIFNEFSASSRLSLDTKAKMRQLISETKLDLSYASGNHDFSSLRLHPYFANN